MAVRRRCGAPSPRGMSSSPAFCGAGLSGAGRRGRSSCWRRLADHNGGKRKNAQTQKQHTTHTSASQRCCAGWSLRILRPTPLTDRTVLGAADGTFLRTNPKGLENTGCSLKRRWRLVFHRSPVTKHEPGDTDKAHVRLRPTCWAGNVKQAAQTHFTSRNRERPLPFEFRRPAATLRGRIVEPYRPPFGRADLSHTDCIRSGN